MCMCDCVCILSFGMHISVVSDVIGFFCPCADKQNGNTNASKTACSWPHWIKPIRPLFTSRDTNLSTPTKDLPPPVILCCTHFRAPQTNHSLGSIPQLPSPLDL